MGRKIMSHVTATKTVEKTLTLETLPKELGPNQFYCYSSKKGIIYIGEVIGKSSLSERSIWVFINGEMLRTSQLEPKFTVYTNIANNCFVCFMRYDDFIKNYNSFLESKVKKNKTKGERRTKYIVDKETFICKKTMDASIPDRCKVFDNMEDAVNYSIKNLARANTFCEKYLEIAKNLNGEIKKMYTYPTKSYTVIGELSRMQPEIKSLSVGTNLIKICNEYGRPNIPMLRIDNSLTVTDVTSHFVRLSDGSIITKTEYPKTYAPFLLITSGAKTVNQLIKAYNLGVMLDTLKTVIDNLERMLRHASSYKPLSKTDYYIYFNKDSIKGKIERISKYIESLQSDKKRMLVI